VSRAKAPSRRGGRHLAVIAPEASPQEAAAIVAALEQFARATAAAAAPAPGAAIDEWTQAALQEATSREPGNLFRDPWINT